MGAGVVFCICIGSRLLAYQHSALISIIPLHTAAKIAHGQMSWLGPLPSLIPTVHHAGPAPWPSPGGLLSPWQAQQNLSRSPGPEPERARGGNSLRKTFVCERFQVKSRPLPDALVSASRSHSWGWFWPSRTEPGVLLPRWLKRKVFAVFALTFRDTVWVQSSQPRLSGAGSFFEGERSPSFPVIQALPRGCLETLGYLQRIEKPGTVRSSNTLPKAGGHAGSGDRAGLCSEISQLLNLCKLINNQYLVFSSIKGQQQYPSKVFM